MLRSSNLVLDTVLRLAAAKEGVDVTLEKDYGGGNVRTTTGVDGTTYTYGDLVTIENTTIGDTVTQMDASETLVLTLADGTTHDVSQLHTGHGGLIEFEQGPMLVLVHPKQWSLFGQFDFVRFLNSPPGRMASSSYFK